MRPAVVLPWREQPGRLAVKLHVSKWLSELLPNAPIIECDTEHEQFNLAAARNSGVRRAEELGCDVVVLCDADTVVVPSFYVTSALTGAHSTGLMYMPFREQKYLNELETADLIDGEPVSVVGGHGGNGAMHIVRTDAYWRAGGGEERFTGWGGDDDAFVSACTAILGPVQRYRGVALSLWHPAVRDVGSERHKPNADLARRYVDAIRSADQMRAIIAERGAS